MSHMTTSQASYRFWHVLAVRLSSSLATRCQKLGAVGGTFT